MDDNQFVPLNPMIDEIGIAGGREDPNVGNISLAAEGGISRQ